MRHYPSNLKKRHSILLVFIPILIYIFYVAQFKIPGNQKKETALEKNKIVKDFSVSNLDSLFEEDFKEEFENLPEKEKKRVRHMVPDFWRSLPH